MKKVFFALSLLNIVLFSGCKKTYQTDDLTGKDWVAEYTDINGNVNYLIFRFYPDFKFARLEMNYTTDPESQDLLIDGNGYEISYKIYTWSWLDDEHTKIKIEIVGLDFVELAYIYEVVKLSNSELILRDVDGPTYIEFEKDNKLLKDTKYEYDPFYSNFVANAKR